LQAAISHLDRAPATLLLLLAILSIQLGAALAITLFPIYGPLGMLFLRMTIGGALLCMLYRSTVMSALRQAPLGILALGLTMAVQSGSFFEALSRIPLGITVAIEFLGPMSVALIASRRLLDVLCVLLAATGIALLTPSIGTSLDPVGVMFAFAAGAGWACFILLCRRLGRVVEGGAGLALAMTIAGLVLFPLVGPAAIAGVAAHSATIVAIIGVVLFSAAIPLLFEFLALKTMPTKKYGVLVSLEPVVATLVGMAVLAETVGLKAWIAVLLITLASIGVALLGRAKASAEAAQKVPG
jgi:inner membrane transporter RhtA